MTDDEFNHIATLYGFAPSRPLREMLEAAVKAEREACARVCEQSDEDGEGPDCWGWHSKDYTAAIRARSKE